VSSDDLVATDQASEDRRLMSRVAGGDADALGELYDHYGRVVFGLIYRMLGSPESAEEVSQNAFHSVWRQASAYRAERGSVRTWLLAIARNAAIDWRRSKANRKDRETAIDESLMLVDELRVEDHVIASLRAQRVRAAVASLPREQQEALSLAFWSGLSQSEIATRTGAPLGTVKSRVRLGMARLREWLSSDEETR
jgi:RNA polymerase sigma-70 factor (ECF subfamily)